jgi:hypothetical protein
LKIGAVHAALRPPQSLPHTERNAKPVEELYYTKILLPLLYCIGIYIARSIRIYGPCILVHSILESAFSKAQYCCIDCKLDSHSYSPCTHATLPPVFIVRQMGLKRHQSSFDSGSFHVDKDGSITCSIATALASNLSSRDVPVDAEGAGDQASRLIWRAASEASQLPFSHQQKLRQFKQLCSTLREVNMDTAART